MAKRAILRPLKLKATVSLKDEVVLAYPYKAGTDQQLVTDMEWLARTNQHAYWAGILYHASQRLAALLSGR